MTGYESWQKSVVLLFMLGAPLPCAQSFDFGSFLLVVSVEMIGMLLNVVHGQVKANITLAPYNITMVSKQPNRQQL